MIRHKNVFVVGLNEANLNRLQTIRNAENLNFHQVLKPEDVLFREDYKVGDLVEKAKQQLASSEDEIDALIHYIDFPVSTMIPILAREFGLPSASLESTLKCEHKYWSRIEQAKAIPQNVPKFAQFDPFDDEALDKVKKTLDFPFWVKPVKSFSSYLGFRVGNHDDWEKAITEIRGGIGRFADSFDYFLDKVNLPAEVGGGNMCLAEGIIGGRQCTVEGFAYRGNVYPYGLVDSVREHNGSSFSRYQYPSRLPQRIQNRMFKLSKKVISHLGYDNQPFNIEFFWDTHDDKVWLLEINTRISESHCNLFEFVDGASHQEVAVDLSLGARPRMPYRCGDHNVAAKFFLRTFEDGYVKRMPDRGEMSRLKEEIPSARVDLLPKVGSWLSELPDQDSYSYSLALVWIGASSQKSLLSKWEKAQRHLHFGLSRHGPKRGEEQKANGRPRADA
jgi:hypothetical protein